MVCWHLFSFWSAAQSGRGEVKHILLDVHTDADTEMSRFQESERNRE